VLAELEVEIEDASLDASRDARGTKLSPAAAAASGSARGYTADRVQLSYSFSSRRLAERRGSELVLRPWFFRGQPGRRYATEPQRKTPLVIGPEVPLVLDASLALPPGATAAVEPQRWQIGQGRGPEYENKNENGIANENSQANSREGGEARETAATPFFLEERTFVAQGPGGGQGALGPGPRVQLHREARLDVVHVKPEAYPALAKDLRRIDLLEQHEMRAKLPPATSSGPDAPGRRGKTGAASRAARRTP
jgi:hypothetical protein